MFTWLFRVALLMLAIFLFIPFTLMFGFKGLIVVAVLYMGYRLFYRGKK